mmetsp:Transcript_42738/g.50072  ORF Transcript_42738/g.50072 Transcript_42738/m.50072 type:complete len:201 (-) Transcript_42738:297-899(-)
MRVCRQRGLARARQAKQHRDVAFLALVGAGVHGEDAPLRHVVVHDAEQAFLHLAGVLRAEDCHFAFLQVDGHAGLVRHRVVVRVGRKLTAVDDEEVRLLGKGLVDLGRRRPDEHLLHEQGVVRPVADHSDCEPVHRVPGCEPVDHEHALGRVQVVDRSGPVDVVAEWRDGHVDVAPPDDVLGCLVENHTFVLRDTACAFA